MRIKIAHLMVLPLCLGVGAIDAAYTATDHRVEVVNTDAGHIDFTFISLIKNPKVFRSLKEVDVNNRWVMLDDGSCWKVAKSDIIKGWDHSKRLLVTQNHANFSLSRYALVNLDLKLAVPASLEHEPVPDKDVAYVKNIDRVNDIVTLNDGKEWIIHSSDQAVLSKISINDRIIIGANTGDNRDKSPYLLIDTSSNHFVRAHHID